MNNQKYNPTEIEKKWPHSAKASRGKQGYHPGSIEKKWQEVWQKNKIYQPNIDKAQNPFYNLMMFPYPSAEGLHMGSVRTFSGVDIYGRFMRMQGNDVFEPFGLDGFGIHAENYALKINKHPMDYSKVTEANFYRQMQSLGTMIDWSRTVETYKPDYYKWTQWLFVELFKNGLAYRRKQEVNYCPSCKTVLADEQVIQKSIKSTTSITGATSNEIQIGVCERCGTEVEKRELEQWFFKITEYADRLLNNIEKLNWSEKVKIAQKNWIGKKEGMEITHKVVGTDITFQTFTAYPAWSYADTFIVIAPEHPLVDKLVAGSDHEKPVQLFKKELESVTSAERMEDKLEKKGVFTGRFAKDPFGGKDMPIWLANFALMDFGTGIVRCSAHDPRDFDFAKKYDIPLKEVVKSESDKPVNAHTNKGKLIDSGQFTGKQVEDVVSEMIDWIEKEKIGKKVTTYHLRDWLISRQRYWGPPIPMIYCEKCADQGHSWFTTAEAKDYFETGNSKLEAREKNPASSFQIQDSNWAVGWYPEVNLPVVLPYVEDFKPIGTGESPLSKDKEFSKVNCPHCGSSAKRETDVSDTFLDSAWYFLRYPSNDIENDIYDIDRTKKWLPVNMYIGGAEHAVLHLFYARFITMFLHDIGKTDFDEPFSRFYAHGLLIKDGAKMSKSKGNVITPDAYINKYGADAVRLYLHFLGPFNQDGDFRDSGIEAMSRFVKRIWTFISSRTDVSTQTIESDKKFIHRTIKEVTEEISNLRYNTAISKLMIYYNHFANHKKISLETAEVFLKLLAPLAPHITEELWQQIRVSEVSKVPQVSQANFESIHGQPWPTYDEKYLVEDEVTIVVQVNGKVRDQIKFQSASWRTNSKSQKEVEKKALASEKVQNYLQGQAPKKVIYIPGKLINIVVES